VVACYLKFNRHLFAGTIVAGLDGISATSPAAALRPFAAATGGPGFAET